MAQRAFHIDRPTSNETASKPYRVRGAVVTHHRSLRSAKIEVSRRRVAGTDTSAVVEKRGADGEWVAQ